MEKIVKWEGQEAMQMQQIEGERTQILARIGALMMDLETSKKSLESINERHKAMINSALQAKGITQFESIRPAQGGITVIVPDNPPQVNGGA